MIPGLTVSPALLAGIVIAIAAAIEYRQTLRRAVREPMRLRAVAKYALVVAGGFVVGRQLAATFGSSPMAWLSAALDAASGVIPV